MGKSPIKPQSKPGAGRPATLKQVAALAGVHASTVSRALNPATRSLVADEVAERINVSAAKLGYRIDRVAASLRTGQSMLVGVLVPDIANPVFSPILGAITETLSAEGYSTIVADVGPDSAKQIELVDNLIGRRVDGLVLATASRDDPVVSRCLERNLPVVLVNRSEAGQRASAVVSDDAVGMELSVDHLFALGHRKIAHLAGPQELSTGFLRRRGFITAMENHGTPRANLAIEMATAYSRDAGKAAAHRLLKRHPDITALATANDLLALGAYDALTEQGLRCPDDLSIVGHNDMPLVDMVQPPLTTVRISHRQMGIEAAKLLLRELRHETTARLNLVLKPVLVVRHSTAAPAKRTGKR